MLNHKTNKNIPIKTLCTLKQESPTCWQQWGGGTVSSPGLYLTVSNGLLCPLSLQHNTPPGLPSPCPGGYLHVITLTVRSTCRYLHVITLTFRSTCRYLHVITLTVRSTCRYLYVNTLTVRSTCRYLHVITLTVRSTVNREIKC